MRLYDLSCDRCGWKAPLPVDEEVASTFHNQPCRECYSHGVYHKFTVKERIVVGPTRFFPARRKGDYGEA